MRLLLVAVIEEPQNPTAVRVEATTDQGQRIAAQVPLAGLSPGQAVIGIEQDGTVRLDPIDPVWSTQATIPPGLTQVTPEVVPMLTRQTRSVVRGWRR